MGNSMRTDASDSPTTAAELVARLRLEPHPEGGWYREVHRSREILQTSRGPRAALTSIYYLLERGQHSRWHVVTSDEIWHHAGGAPLELLTYQPANRSLRRLELRPGESIGVVDAGDWQAARSLGDWSLMACDVAPGFDFEDFSFVSASPGHESVFDAELAPYAELL